MTGLPVGWRADKSASGGWSKHSGWSMPARSAAISGRNIACEQKNPEKIDIEI